MRCLGNVCKSPDFYRHAFTTLVNIYILVYLFCLSALLLKLIGKLERKKHEMSANALTTHRATARTKYESSSSAWDGNASLRRCAPIGWRRRVRLGFPRPAEGAFYYSACCVSPPLFSDLIALRDSNLLMNRVVRTAHFKEPIY